MKHTPCKENISSTCVHGLAGVFLLEGTNMNKIKVEKAMLEAMQKYGDYTEAMKALLMVAEKLNIDPSKIGY